MRERRPRPGPGNGSSAKAWVRALELTAPIASHPQRILPTVIEELAAQFGEAPALLSDRECLTYRALAERSNRYARWALDRASPRATRSACSCQTGRNTWPSGLASRKVGGVVALLNTNLTGPSLAHCINIVAPKHLIVAAELIDRLTTALPDLTARRRSGSTAPATTHCRALIAKSSGTRSEKLSDDGAPALTIEDPALYIYTSGTTGLPKAASVSHGRLMQWSHWFAGMMDTRPADRMYNCLPMYHSVGGVLAPGAVLVGGGSVVMREKFSASEFWSDVVRWDCTLFQYIGELCRYLLHTESIPHETEHRIRMACGNGLRADIWSDFKNRFRIPRILEFYAATEGNVSLFNIDGKPGSIGRIPPYLAHRFPVDLGAVRHRKGRADSQRSGILHPLRAQRNRRSDRQDLCGPPRTSAVDSTATRTRRLRRRRSSATCSSRETPGFVPAI